MEAPGSFVDDDCECVVWCVHAALLLVRGQLNHILHTGMYIVVSYSAIQALLRQRRAGAKNRVLLAYACIMAAITWLWFIVGAIWSQRNLAAEDPDNPNQYDTLQCTPLGIVKDELAVLMVLGSDALLVRSLPLLPNSLPSDLKALLCLALDSAPGTAD